MDEQEHEGALFLKQVFGPVTTGPIFLTSLPNNKDDIGLSPRQVVTRDVMDITRFCRSWDQQGRGLFFCVATLKPNTTRRAKANISEILGLHTDIDLKGVTLPAQEVLEKLDAARLLPTYVVGSGHGFHGYWLLREALPATPENIERVEAALHLLADLFGGDPSVCEVSRLMRLPGTHNTKEGGFVPVRVVRHSPAAMYELEELEEWLSETSPVIARREMPYMRGSLAQPDNPFLAVAKRLGFKPPIDVERRLEEMTYQGPGDSGIHATQLAVSASLLLKGVPMGEVVEILLAATNVAAGSYGERWNWKREAIAITRMCADWVRKNPPKVDALRAHRKPAQAAASGEGPVVQLKEERARRAPKAPVAAPPGKKEQHVVLGRAVIEVIRGRGCDLMFTPKGAYRYEGGLWRLEVDGLRAWLDVEIETGARALSLKSTNRLIGETRGWITRNPDLWVEEVPWDEHGMVPTKSGLVDPATLHLTPLAPDHYATWRVDAAYDPVATCPWWKILIGDVFADRPDDVRRDLTGLIQEVLGAALLDTKPRQLSKALLFQGGSNYGKSVLLEVLGGLFGPEQIPTGLEAIEGAHGLMRFTKRLPWVLHEAFDQRKWHLSSTVKAIITGEPVNVNIKNGPMLSIRVRGPVFWATNHPPQFKEETRAIVNRLLVIACKREFGGKPIGAAAEAAKRKLQGPAALVLASEMPGLLNWALAGLRRALERGAFAVPQEVLDTGDEIRRDTNLVAGFLEECVEYDPNRRLAVPDFCAAFSVWWEQNMGERRGMPSNTTIGKALVAMGDRRIGIHPELRDKTRRYHAGILLNPAGLKFWEMAVESKLFEGKRAGMTTTGGEINSAIPVEWNGKAAVRSIRLINSMTDGGNSHTDFSHLSSTKMTHDRVTGEAVSPDASSGEVPEKSREPRF